MPYKNMAAYLNACIDSILQQNHDNWELIAVNDHSEDSSEEIIQNYAASDDRIFTVKNNGKGITPALLTGEQFIRGEFVSRMDADDIMPPKKLAKLLSCLTSSNQYDIATGKVTYFSENPIGQGYQAYEKWLNTLIEQQTHWEHIFTECVIASPNWLIRKQAFVKAGGFDSQFYPEDYDLCFRWWRNQLTIKSCEDITHWWREHANRTSRNSEDYMDLAFSQLKIHYFLKDVYQGGPITIWGTGKKAKDMVSLLLPKVTSIQWVSNNPEKIGKKIKGITIEPLNSIRTEHFHLITIAQIKTKQQVSDWLLKRGLRPFKNYIFMA